MDSENKTILITEENNIRLDKYLADKLSDFSRSYLSQLISDKAVLVNGNPSKASQKLKEGDRIEIELPEPTVLEVLPEKMDLDIVYEDSDVIVINKPQGVVVHPAAGNYTGTLVNGLMYHCKDSLSTINGVMRPGIVHRIDKDTSGLVVICKNDNAHRFLAKQFEEHSITRIYTAVCHGCFNTRKDEYTGKLSAVISSLSNLSRAFAEVDEDGRVTGTVNAPLGRCPSDRKKMAIVPDGRRAVTHFTVEKKLTSERLGEAFSLITCRLETGRTHQIRVHMSSIKHPIVGDPVYGPKKCPFKLEGQLLHAGVLGFIHPSTNEYVEFRSELPDYFQAVLDDLKEVY